MTRWSCFRGRRLNRCDSRHSNILMTNALVVLGFLAMTVSAEDLADLTVTSPGGFGDTISVFSVTVTGAGIVQTQEASFGFTVFRGLPFGRYSIRVRSNGYLSRERVMDIRGHSVWLPVVLPGDMPIDPLPIPRLIGRIQNMRHGDVLRVKLISIFDDTSLTAQPDDSGNFEFAGMPPGRYLVVIYTGEVLVRQVDASVNHFNINKDILTITL